VSVSVSMSVSVSVCAVRSMTSDRTFVANQEGQIGVLRQKDDGTHEHVHTLKDLKVCVLFGVVTWHGVNIRPC
jgi:hypothetical protein